MSQPEDKQSEPTKAIINRVGDMSAQIAFDNMSKLCNEDVYECAGEKYKRRILKPKELAALYKLQGELDKIKDPEKRLENVYEQAKICLEGVTQDKWDNTDIVKMEIIIGACVMITKGFRKI